MISVNNLCVEFQAKPLFDGVTFNINPRERVALVGRNGAGKTTMLRLLAGKQSPTSGSITMPSGTTIGYLPQVMTPADDTTVADEVRKAFAHVDAMQQRLDAMQAELAGRTDYESESYAALISAMTDLQERLLMEHSENHEAELERTLMGLGFKRTDFGRATSEFSGGWRMRIELAKLLLGRPDVLLLDEPTNHLDIESIQWLEQFLTQKAGAVVLVSHDRAFLDNVTRRTIEISLGKIYDYDVPYSRFTALRAERIEQQTRAYNNQRKQIEDTEAFIERFRYKATKSVQVQSRIKQLERIERIEIDTTDTSRLSLRFPPAPRSGDFPVTVDDVGKAYGSHQVFDHASLTLRRGDKVAFVGRNGEGKTTLVKCIMQQINDFTGSLRIGHNVKIGYFAQNEAQLLDGEISVFDTIDRVATGDIRTKIRDLLGAFMFGGEDIDKKVKVLSGGERSRLAMIRLLLQPVNLLILDEPTNHLDMSSKDVLKQAVKAFDGTVIVVSHDREFLDGLVDRVYEFADGRVRECLGGIYEFLAMKQAAQTAAEAPSLVQKTAPKPAEKEAAKTPEPKGKVDYRARREAQKAVSRQKKLVEAAEAEIAVLEQQLKEIEEQLAGGEYNPELIDSHAATQRRLENAMSVWELESSRLESLS